MNPHASKKCSSSTHIIVTFSFLLSIFIAFSGLTSVYAVEMFSKDVKPFGISYDDWVAKYWNKRIGMNKDQATPKPGGCLILNKENNSVARFTRISIHLYRWLCHSIEQAVSDGNWVFLQPLSIGKHVIYFNGDLKNEDSKNNTTSIKNTNYTFAGPYGWDYPVTYHITLINSTDRSSSLPSSYRG